MKILLLLLTLSLTVNAKIKSKVSPYSVKVTMNKFEKLIKEKGFSIFARIDHQKNAKEIGLKMNSSEVIIFGNPKGGTKLMNMDIRISLDLPLKVAVYRKNEKVYISYRDPLELQKKYKLESNKVLTKVNNGLDMITSSTIRK